MVKHPIDSTHILVSLSNTKGGMHIEQFLSITWLQLTTFMQVYLFSEML